MISHYLKTAFRIISRNRLFSIINIFGLSIGIACFILIFLWISDEISYDRYNSKAERIYRVVMEKEDGSMYKKIARTPPPVGRAIKERYPEIEKSTRFFFMKMGFIHDNSLYNENGAFVDTDIFSVFDINLIEGDIESTFSAPFNIIISKSLALKIFSSTDVLGKMLKVGETTSFTIKGVFEDIPENSHMDFDFLIPYDALFQFGLPREMWDNYNNINYSYVLVNKTANINELNQKIRNLIIEQDENLKLYLFLQPLNDVYLKSNFSGDYPTLGNIKNIYIFSVISIFILIIASFNFMNLTTAQSASRLKEIGVKKVVGSHRRNLVLQFLGEALLLTFVAHIFAIIIVELTLPLFNNITSKSLHIDYFNIDFLLLIVSIIAIVGLFSGSYPSSYLSSIKPLMIFRGGETQNKRSSTIRRILVILQFTIATGLITGSIAIKQQMNYLSESNLGFKKSNLVYFNLKGNGNQYELLKERLLNNSGINNVTVSSHELTDVVHLAEVEWEGKKNKDKALMNLLFVDHDFIPTMQMQLIEGNDFIKKHHDDTVSSFILNESAVKQLDIENPVGKRFSLGRLNGYIKGVVKDFHYQPLYNDIKPLVLSTHNSERYYLYVRINPDKSDDIIPTIEEEFHEIDPEAPFEYYYLEDSIDKMYSNELKLSKLVDYFTILIILISCLGLFGLASFMAERRTKEIGIRKALGSSLSNILLLMTKEILMWILMANVLSVPFTYFFLKNWLQNFSYHIDLKPWIFLGSALITIIIGIATTLLKAWTAARENPVKALRYE